MRADLFRSWHGGGPQCGKAKDFCRVFRAAESEVAIAGYAAMRRRLIYLGLLAAALLGGFFLTLWQLDDARVSAVDPADARSDSEPASR